MAEKTALVVDDSRSSRYAMRKFLERAGYTVDTAESAQDAYVYLQRRHPQVIFLDHQMPGSDGLDVLRVLKDDADSADIPVMLCSGKDDDAFLRMAREAGAAAVLPKPPDPQQLTALLQNLADTRAGSRSGPKISATRERTPPILDLPTRASVDQSVEARRSEPTHAGDARRPATSTATGRVAPSFGPDPVIPQGPAQQSADTSSELAMEVRELRREVERLQAELEALRQQPASGSVDALLPTVLQALEQPINRQARRAVAQAFSQVAERMLQDD